MVGPKLVHNMEQTVPKVWKNLQVAQDSQKNYVDLKIKHIESLFSKTMYIFTSSQQRARLNSEYVLNWHHGFVYLIKSWKESDRWHTKSHFQHI